MQSNPLKIKINIKLIDLDSNLDRSIEIQNRVDANMPIAKYFIEYQSDTDTEPTAACPWLTHGRYDRGRP